MDSQKNAINFSTTDFDNDGKLDIYLHRGGWFTKLDGEVKNALLRNDGSKFVDVTQSMGLDTGFNANVSSNWFDFDNDGKLDLFVCHERRSPELFRNQGKKFVEMAGQAGIANDRLCKGSAVGDVNNDGYLDIFISNYTGVGRLYINNQDGTFREDRQESIEKGNKWFSFGTFFFDYDNDGWEDLFIATLNPYFEDTLIDLFKIKKAKKFDAKLKLLKNVKGRLIDVSERVGLSLTVQTMGLNFGDFDNDGFLDIYLGTGSTPYGSLSPNRAFRNRDGKRFEEVTFAGGFGNLQKGHGISFGDLNLDGHQDILKNLGGHVDASEFVPELLMNPGNMNNWVRLNLNGKKSNSFGIGSKIHLKVAHKEKIRNIYFRVGGTGSYGQNSVVPLIGVGKSDKILSANIVWSGSNLSQTFQNLPINKTVVITEGESRFSVPEEARKIWKVE